MPLRVRTFSAFLVAYFLSYFFRSTNAVIADDLSRELSLSPEQLGLMTGIFFACFAAVQLPIGQALDRFGARWVNSLIMLLAVLGAIIFGAAQNFTLLVLGRALIGIGMASALMGALKALSHLFAERQYAVISGVFVAFGALGALAAATPLAWLNASSGWRPVFFWGAGITLLSSAAIWLFSRDQGSDSSDQEGSLLEVLSDHRIWRIACLNFALAGSFFAYQSLWLGPYMRDVMAYPGLPGLWRYHQPLWLYSLNRNSSLCHRGHAAGLRLLSTCLALCLVDALPDDLGLCHQRQYHVFSTGPQPFPRTHEGTLFYHHQPLWLWWHRYLAVAAGGDHRSLSRNSIGQLRS
jgi:MFS family permease